MKHIIFCTGVDFYAHVSDSDKVEDYEQIISFWNGCQMEALSELSMHSPALLEYLDFDDFIFPD